MAIKLDFSDIDVGGFEALPDGTYPGVIAAITQERGKSSGKPYLKMVIKLQESEELGVKKGRQVFTNFSLQPQALWRLKQLMIRLGWSKDELDSEFDLEPGDLIGRDVVTKLGPANAGYSGNNVLDVLGEDAAVGVAETADSGF